MLPLDRVNIDSSEISTDPQGTLEALVVSGSGQTGITVMDAGQRTAGRPLYGPCSRKRLQLVPELILLSPGIVPAVTCCPKVCQCDVTILLPSRHPGRPNVERVRDSSSCLPSAQSLPHSLYRHSKVPSSCKKLLVSQPQSP